MTVRKQKSVMQRWEEAHAKSIKLAEKAKKADEAWKEAVDNELWIQLELVNNGYAIDNNGNWIKKNQGSAAV